MRGSDSFAGQTYGFAHCPTRPATVHGEIRVFLNLPMDRRRQRAARCGVTGRIAGENLRRSRARKGPRSLRRCRRHWHLSAELFKLWPHVEMAQVFHRAFASAGLRGHGDGTGRCSAGLWRRRHHMGAFFGGRGMLVCHFFPPAQADVDLCLWA